ncbi:unnamed protein product [Acidithrix sp. C25]|nr:unnamed protein product [Acidithrix sp. C25]
MSFIPLGDAIGIAFSSFGAKTKALGCGEASGYMAKRLANGGEFALGKRLQNRVKSIRTSCFASFLEI